MTDIIKSNLFWHYAIMIDKLFSVFSLMMSWSEACSCHLDVAATLSDDPRNRELRKYFEIASHCPMRGRRATDMALGSWRAFFRSVREASLLEIRADASVALNMGDVNVILKDFASGTAQQEAVLEHKFAFWSQLPLHLAGLADADLDRARQCASACVAQYDTIGSEAAHHRVANRFLSKSGWLRAQVRTCSQRIVAESVHAHTSSTYTYC